MIVEEILMVLQDCKTGQYETALSIHKYFKRKACLHCGCRNTRFYIRIRQLKTKRVRRSGNVCLLCHKDKKRKDQRVYYLANKATHYKRAREWKIKNKDKVNASIRRRYHAKKVNSEFIYA